MSLSRCMQRQATAIGRTLRGKWHCLADLCQCETRSVIAPLRIEAATSRPAYTARLGLSLTMFADEVLFEQRCRVGAAKPRGRMRTRGTSRPPVC